MGSMDDTPEAVLFDLDNTLIPFMAPLRAWATAWAGTAAPDDAPAVADALVQATLDGEEDPARGLERVPERFDLAGDPDEATARAWSAYEDALAPYPGVCGLLADLVRRDVSLGIVTDAPRERAMHRLTGTGLAHAFEVIVTRDETPKGKQGPEPFELALSVLEHAPRRAVMIGDWPAYDVEWPHRLGMRAVLAGWGIDPTDPRARVDELPCPIAGAPSEVPGILFDTRPARRVAGSRAKGQAAITAF